LGAPNISGPYRRAPSAPTGKRATACYDFFINPASTCAMSILNQQNIRRTNGLRLNAITPKRRRPNGSNQRTNVSVY